MILDHEKISRIKNALKFKSKGMSISEIAQQLKMNRNSVAKYLEILLMSGEVEAKTYGTSKVYTLSQRVPVSAMMGFSSDMIIMVDDSHRILQVNDRFLQVAGVPRETVIGQRIEDTDIPFLNDLPVDIVLKEMTEKKTRTIEKKVHYKGSDAYFSIKIVPTIFDDGKEGATIIIEDISARLRSEIALADSVKLYQSVIENIQDVFYRSDKDGNLIMASPSWAAMLGYDSLDECIGKNIAKKFYMEPSCRKEFLDAVYSKGSVNDYEVVLKKKDGKPLFVSTNSHLYYDESGAVIGVEGIFRDITERHEAAVKIKNHIAQMEFFSQKILEFIELAPESNIYEKIASDLKSLIPDANIAVSSYNDATGIVTIRSWLFGPDGRKIFFNFVGKDPVGLDLPISIEGITGMRTGRLLHLNLSFYQMLFKAVPEDLCNQLERKFNIGETYGIGFVQEGMILGSAVIAIPKGSTISDIQLIETYARAASIVLQRGIAEQALKKSEELFSNIAENSPLPIAIIDPDGTYRFINRSFIQTFGYDLRDFKTGREWFLLAFPEPQYRKQVVGAWKSDLEHSNIGDLRPRIYTVRCKDGAEKIIYFRPVTLSDGKQCVVYEDITVHKEAARVRTLLSEIIESTDDAVIGKNVDGTIISWNKAAQRIYGYSPDEIIGHHISQIIPPERRKEMEQILGMIRYGEAVNNLETLRVRKDGKVIEVAVTISPIKDDDGTVIGASTIARNISFRKAEERLKESEEKYRSLVNNIAVGVYRSTGDPKGRFIWGNSSLVRILGHPSIEALKTIDVADIFVEQDGRKKLLEELQKSGFVKNKEFPVRRADGKTIYVSVTALAQFNAKGDIACINGVVEDITERLHAESKLQIMNKEVLDIIEFIPDATFIVGNDKKVVAWNMAMERLTGVKKADIIGKGEYTYAFPFYGDRRPLLADLIDASDEEIQHFYTDVKRDGATLIAEVLAPAIGGGKGAFFFVKASPLTDPSGNRIGVIETIREIPELQRAHPFMESGPVPADSIGSQSQSQPANANVHGHAGQTPELLSLLYLSNALRMAQDGITILDLSARCMWTNDALLALLGAGSSDAIVGKSVAHYIAPELRKATLDRLSGVRKHGHDSFPVSLMTPNGRVPVEARVSVVADTTGEILGYMAIMRQLQGARQKGGSRSDVERKDRAGKKS